MIATVLVADLVIGAAMPALGPVATSTGLDSVFLTGTLLVLCTVPIAVRRMGQPAREQRTRHP